MSEGPDPSPPPSPTQQQVQDYLNNLSQIPTSPLLALVPRFGTFVGNGPNDLFNKAIALANEFPQLLPDGFTADDIDYTEAGANIALAVVTNAQDMEATATDAPGQHFFFDADGNPLDPLHVSTSDDEQAEAEIHDAALGVATHANNGNGDLTKEIGANLQFVVGSVVNAANAIMHGNVFAAAKDLVSALFIGTVANVFSLGVHIFHTVASWFHFSKPTVTVIYDDVTILYEDEKDDLEGNDGDDTISGDDGYDALYQAAADLFGRELADPAAYGFYTAGYTSYSLSYFGYYTPAGLSTYVTSGEQAFVDLVGNSWPSGTPWPWMPDGGYYNGGYTPPGGYYGGGGGFYGGGFYGGSYTPYTGPGYGYNPGYSGPIGGSGDGGGGNGGYTPPSNGGGTGGAYYGGTGSDPGLGGKYGYHGPVGYIPTIYTPPYSPPYSPPWSPPPWWYYSPPTYYSGGYTPPPSGGYYTPPAGGGGYTPPSGGGGGYYGGGGGGGYYGGGGGGRGGGYYNEQDF